MFAAGLTMGWLDWGQTYNITDWAANAVGIQGLGCKFDDLSYEEHDEFLLAAQPFILPEKAAQASVVQDVIGSPVQEAVMAQVWKSMEVTDLANTIYNDRCFNRLPLLAAALECAGCDSIALLAHCRSNCQHTRGCWALDLVLGKK
ncbi:MAG: hypothetical protein JWM11_2192 [Planctomycetaceae bacterium]|nr:hypothetical protein [Planctomycetaceae bacterium]